MLLILTIHSYYKVCFKTNYLSSSQTSFMKTIIQINWQHKINRKTNHHNLTCFYLETDKTTLYSLEETWHTQNLIKITNLVSYYQSMYFKQLFKYSILIMRHSRNYGRLPITRDLYSLIPVSQFRIQQNIELKKKNRGKKKDEIQRNLDWTQFENEQQFLGINNHIFLESKQLTQRSTLKMNEINPPKRNDKLTKQSIQDARVSNFYFSKFMNVQHMCLLLTFLSFLINLVYTEVNKGKQLDLILIVTSVLTATLVSVIIIRYYTYLQLLKTQKILKYDGTFFWKLYKSGSLYHMILEIAVVLIHPNIVFKNVEISELQAFSLYTITHQVNDILALLLLLRVYIVLRGMLSQTVFYSPRASRLCRIHLCDHNIMFSVKCILKEYPLRALIIIFFFLLFIFGHGIKLTESPLAKVEFPLTMDFTNYLNCFWCIIVTMGTIGYGDYYPRTIPGRIVLFLTSVCGVLLSSLLIVALSAYLNMTTQQNKAHICIKRLKLQDIVTREAAKAMVAVVKLGKCNKNSNENFQDPLQQRQFDSVYEQLKEHTSNTKSLMRQIKSLVDNNNLYEQMQRYFTILKNNFNQIFMRQQKLKRYLLQIASMSSSEQINVISFAKTLEQKAFQK